MIEQLKLYDSKFTKIRLGNPCDGGYVIPSQALCQSSCLFSYGVGYDISFEIDYTTITNKKSFCFDHLCDFQVPAEFEKKIIFLKEGLSSAKTNQTDNFINHYKKYFNLPDNLHQDASSSKVLLKIDIEGNEYDYFINSDIQYLSKITTGLIIEFHGINDPEIRNLFFYCMTMINRYFYLCHIHGNNNTPNFNYFEKRFCEELDEEYIQKFSLPACLELSFVSKEIFPNAERDLSKYPCHFLDKVNNILRPECDLNFTREI